MLSNLISLEVIFVFQLVQMFQVLKAQSAAKANGFSDVIYLDCVHKRYLEEVSSSNIFVVKVIDMGFWL